MFSKLAKHLIKKLTAFEPAERYNAVQAQKHPFLTGKEED